MTRWLLPLALMAGCKDKSAADSAAPPLEPGALMAGVARVRTPAPLGIGTAGYGPFDAPSSNSPFAEIYPATTRLHGHPEIKAVVISRGEGFEIALVRIDSIGMFQQLRRALVLELEARLGRDMDAVLVIGATHTHSGPGRVVDGGGLFDFIADTFFPDFYVALVDAMADAVEAAYDDLRPARVGGGAGYDGDGHSDRRCEDGLEYENGTLPLLAVERDGQVDAVVMAYAIHGTSLGLDDLSLSQDVSGAIEQAVEDRFDHPVEALMFNSWGADMAPGSPDVALREGAARPDGYDRMEQIGQSVADAAEIALADAAWWDTPDIGLDTFRFRIDREVIGYADEEFPYEYGGLYCETGEDDCDPATTIADLDQHCLPFLEDYPAPIQTEMSAGQVGEVFLLTFPGEPGTLLAEQVMADIRAAHPDVGELMFMGYTQDYIGYSILEDDWWQGGYEASGAIWGPRQGEYLAAKAVTAAGAYLTGGAIDDPADFIVPFDDPVYEPYQAETALDAGTIAADVAASYAATDVVSLTVLGSDPWLGPPMATLESADGQPALRPNGVPVDSDDYNFWLDLVMDPTWDEDHDPSSRAFYWTISLAAVNAVPGGLDLSGGSWRLRVQVPTAAGDVEVLSGEFSVSSLR